MSYGNYIDPNGSEMPGPKLRRMGVQGSALSLQQTLQKQAEAKGLTVDSFVRGIADKPEAYVRPNAVQQASCLRLQDEDQLAVIDKFRAAGMQDEVIRNVVASMALHAASSFGLVSTPFGCAFPY